MKVLVAPDSFKGSLTSGQIIELVEAAGKRVLPDCQVLKMPIADGGEGTVDALVEILKGEKRQLAVKNPLLETIYAAYGIVNGDTAVIEMAQASGLPLIEMERRNPLYTSTYGTGELIRGVLEAGFRKIIIGIGGSATNDGGIGAMEALGARFLDGQGRQVKGIGESLGAIETIDLSNLMPELKAADIQVMCDVDNPLTGQRGATFVYGPQKGGTAEILERLEAGMLHYERLIRRDLGIDLSRIEGAGAAGGLGGALMAFLGAKLKSGIETILEVVDFAHILGDVDLVVTGEGRLDRQSAYGKVISGIGKACLKQGVPVVALVGSIGEGAEAIYDCGISGIVPIVNGPMTLAEAMDKAQQLTLEGAERLFRLIKIGGGMN